METTMYTFTANEIVVAGDAVRQASGGDRRMVYLRHPAPEPASVSGGKVIDFNAWRAAQEEQSVSSMDVTTFPEEINDFEDFFPEEGPVAEDNRPVHRPRTHHARRARTGMYLDWMATAALIAVSISVCISFLL